MSIPSFNADGLLPPGIHSATMAELEQKLGFSPKRYVLVEGLKQVTGELVKLGVTEVYVNGSFVTNKISPKDVDVYVPVPIGSVVFNEIAKRRDEWQAQNQVDIYPAVTDVEEEGSLGFFEGLFGRTKEFPQRPKGYVKLVLRR